MLILDDAYIRKLTANYEGGRFIKTVVLIEDPAVPTASYWCDNPEPITWSGLTFQPLHMVWTNMQTSQGMPIEAAAVTVSNLAGLAGKYVKQLDVTGNTVTLRLLHEDLLHQLTGHWERRAKVMAIRADQSMVNFTLGRWLGRGVLPRKIYTQDEFPGVIAGSPAHIMIEEETKKRIADLCNKPVALGGWLGIPYEDEGCLKFAMKFFSELGIEISKVAFIERRNFMKVEEPQFGDVAIFHGVQFVGGGFHVGVMLDYRKCIQCIPQTNGVGKIDISSPTWMSSLKAFYRHKDLCS